MDHSDKMESETDIHVDDAVPAVTGYAKMSGPYRYVLSRSWRREGEPVRFALWVMLNPSTANGTEDDPTIRKVVKFSRSWGMNQAVVVNLFAWRSKSPSELRDMARMGTDVVGPFNETYLTDWLGRKPDKVICAWGTNVDSIPRGYDVASKVLTLIGLNDLKAEALRITDQGHPQHPLYLPANSPLVQVPYPYLKS